jgi:hypothetical protein
MLPKLFPKPLYFAKAFFYQWNKLNYYRIFSGLNTEK